MSSGTQLDQRRHDDAPVTTSKTIDPSRALLAEAVTINRPAQKLYEFWRNPRNLLPVMENIQAIEVIDDTRSRWTVKAPGERELSWESVVTKDVPGKEIYWQSAPGADIANSGRIEFREAGPRGTVVRATIAYDPPGGAIGQFIAKLSPDLQSWVLGSWRPGRSRPRPGPASSSKRNRADARAHLARQA